MAAFTLDEVLAEVNQVSISFSVLQADLTNIGAPLSESVLGKIGEAYRYVYLREVPSTPVNDLCWLVESIYELAELVEVDCMALCDMESKCSILMRYDLDGYIELEDLAALLNTTEEHLEESLGPLDLFYIEENIYPKKSPRLVNDPMFVRLDISVSEESSD